MNKNHIHYRLEKVKFLNLKKYHLKKSKKVWKTTGLREQLETH